jgi:hypothetical protein
LGAEKPQERVTVTGLFIQFDHLNSKDLFKNGNDQKSDRESFLPLIKKSFAYSFRR